MQIRIRHVTEYAYDAPVALGPHVLRLWPRPDPTVRILDYRIDVSPEPCGRSFFLDAHGNSALSLWFLGTTARLRIEAGGVVETLRDNPFDYVLPAESRTVPLRWTARMGPTLFPFLSIDGSDEATPVHEWAREMIADAEHEILPFLDRLNRSLNRTIRIIHRAQGEPWPSWETLRRGEGACRDVAMLFVEMCREVGIPARFVSGYALPSLAGEELSLHAWAEVCLPGCGWRGYDPSLGLAVADQHIPLAAGAPPITASPVEGLFWGDGNGGSMSTRLWLENLETPEEAGVGY